MPIKMVFAVLKQEGLNEKLVRIHRIGFEKRDREGFLALFDGNVADAMEKFTLAEKHSRKLYILLQNPAEKSRVLEGSLEMSNRMANLRALSSSNRTHAGAAMLRLLANLRRDA